MIHHRWLSVAIVALCTTLVLTAPVHSVLADDTRSAPNCSFVASPDAFLSREARVRETLHLRAIGFQSKSAARGATAAVAPGDIPRRNFIDDEIFGRLEREGVNSAPLTTDLEFIRRVTLDLTGRLPVPDDTRAFAASTDPNKRRALIDKLLNTPEFIDKWTWWLSDLLQVNAVASTFNRQVGGRDAFYNWIKAQVSENQNLQSIAYNSVVAGGNNFLMPSGASNFAVVAQTPGGPIQDTYDTMLVRTASTFMGMGYYDCVLCHNGRGHLEQLSLWGRSATRLEAQRMAAFFSRLQMANDPTFAGSRLVTDRPAGTYDLNTTFGNRPIRCATGATVINNRCSATTSLTPEYHFTGAKPAEGQNWREAFAGNMVWDAMFSRNMVNRLWKEMFSLGLVDPLDTMDPLRMDPNNPPPDPWTLQPTHPGLLEQLRYQFIRNNFSLKETLRFIAESSAYQLSSRYDDGWKYEYTALFARHFPRRLEGEEIADAIAQTTGMPNLYTVQGWPQPASWAMQLPEPREPTSNSGGALSFMNAFLRGNRDTQQRSQSGSILQQLNLMNDPFVTNRNKVGASVTLRGLANNSDNQQVIDQMYLLFLSRYPSEYERTETLTFLRKATTQAARNTAIEDLAWTMMNRLEFIFSY